MKNITRWTVEYSGQTIDFTIVRKKVKNINMRITASQGVVVSASTRVPVGYIKKFVRSKGAWVLSNMKVLKEKSEKASHRVGEIEDWGNIKILDEDYVIRIIQSDKNSIVTDHGFLCIYMKTAEDPSAVKITFDKWLKNKAAGIFGSALERLYPQAEYFGIPKPSIHIREMKTRWGTCVASKKKIWLNLKLIHYPQGCIDYVLMHELAHFKAGNHGKDFYYWLEKLMPDWKHWKAILKGDE